MSEVTSQDMREAHARIDKLVECVSRTAALQERLTQDIDRLTKTVNAGVHIPPCFALRELTGRVEDIEDAGRQTVAVAREKGRDWRMLWFAIGGAGVGGAVATLIPHLMGVHP